MDIKNIEPLSLSSLSSPSSPISAKISLLIVDRESFLAIRFKEPEGEEEEYKQQQYETKYTYNQAIMEEPVATYSTSKSTVLSYVAIFESLWKELEVNEQITSLFEQLKYQDNRRKDFLSIAAHELRAPIQPVLGLAEVLRSNKKVDMEEQQELITVIIRNAKRLKVLTENILDLTRIESQTSLTLHKEVFNICEPIFESVKDIKSQLSNGDKKRINIQYDFTREEELEGKNEGAAAALVAILVEADRNRLMQVISNLLNNAINFTKVGTILINVEKKVDSGNHGEVIVSIKDNGPGIDPDIMPRLFSKFASKSEHGVGLGLFISRTIVETHGGRIWAENNTGGEKGATFAFGLPLKR